MNSLLTVRGKDASGDQNKCRPQTYVDLDRDKSMFPTHHFLDIIISAFLSSSYLTLHQVAKGLAHYSNCTGGEKKD